MLQRKVNARFRSFLEKFLYRSIYLFVNFFIYVGEGTEFILFLPFRLIRFIYVLLEQILKTTSPKIKRGTPYVQKALKNISRTTSTIFKSAKHRIFYFSEKLFEKLSAKPGKIAITRKRKKEALKPKISPIEQPVFARFRYFFVGFGSALLIVFIYQSYLFVNSLPSPKSIGKVNYPLSTHIYDRNGKLLYEFYREQNRTPIKLTDLPPYIFQATVAIEDKDFFKHKGISPIGGIFRALKEDIINRQLQGGSTITQQLVKSALLTPERTIQRKFKEILLALWTERLYTKQQILEMYLNQVPYGGSAYGIEEAAKTYFNKSAKNLAISEAAFLAGLPQAPTLYSPFVNPTVALSRKNNVLKKMYDQKYITQAEYQSEVDDNLNIATPKTEIKAPHFVFYVKNDLVRRFGIQNVEEGGLRAVTTLDLDLQEKVEEILRDEIEKIRGLNVTNGGILVTKPQTGEILAMVGSVDYFATPSGAFNVTTALRQPGSSIKPLMYSLALEKGYTASTTLEDNPVVFVSAGSPPYRPVNYDGRFHGRQPLRFALANSYNVPAVRTLNSIGVDNFVRHARNMGISTWDDSSRFGLSLTLGGGEVTMVDMAKAFGVFANLGERKNIAPLIKVDDVADNILFESRQFPLRVLDPGVAFIISDILSDNQSRVSAFGSHSSLEIPNYKVAVKTGTTDSKKDNWTIGYTPEFLVAVWVGNNDNTPMNPQLTSGITGAAPIWNRVMTYLLTNYSSQNSWFTTPDNLVEKNCYGAKKEYFLKGTEDKGGCGRIYGPTPTPTAQVYLPN